MLILSCILGTVIALVLLAISLPPGWAAATFAALALSGLITGGLCEAAGRADEEMENALKRK